MAKVSSQLPLVPLRPRGGELRRINGISYDVMLEILRRMHPADLMHLSRTTKAFRSLIMSASSKWLWECSFSQDPTLPPCPAEFSLPFWTSFLFDRHCQECSVPNVDHDWGLLVRLCAKCADRVYCKHYGSFYDRVNISKLVLMRPYGRKHASLESQLLDVVKQYKQLEGDGVALKKFLEERAESVRRLKEITNRCSEWATELRRTRLEETLKQEGWAHEIAHMTQADREQFECHRLVAQPRGVLSHIGLKIICSRLLQFMEQCKAHRLEVEERRSTLTCRIYIASKALQQWKNSHPLLSELVPSLADFIRLPDVEKVLQRSDEEAIDLDTFCRIIPVGKQVQVWLKDILRRFADHMHDTKQDIPWVSKTSTPEEIVSALHLATTVLRCPHCDQEIPLSPVTDIADGSIAARGTMHTAYDPLGGLFSLFDEDESPVSSANRRKTTPISIPCLFGHSCQTFAGTTKPVEIVELVHGESVRVPVPGPGVWECPSLTVDKERGAVIEAIVRACGLSPATTTCKDMDREGRMACMVCPVKKDPGVWRFQCMTWRKAIEHVMKDHPKDISFRPLGDGPGDDIFTKPEPPPKPDVEVRQPRLLRRLRERLPDIRNIGNGSIGPEMATTLLGYPELRTRLLDLASSAPGPLSPEPKPVGVRTPLPDPVQLDFVDVLGDVSVREASLTHVLEYRGRLLKVRR
ncbi:hypothetical protein OE88DRAFT_1649621 [Heliocybe sulcata]|uniref:F-box domain-containing protein n=1 Tax=Heliocybe sulcata TaxID=5364 RepID=A0A5C3NHJ4_9AGAM|nr:hypothetical protein OE88DRAFT_1649621 [Heliocybe sulcata]